jgi:hypothetical protein
MSLLSTASNLFINGNPVSLAYLNGNQIFSSSLADVIEGDSLYDFTTFTFTTADTTGRTGPTIQSLRAFYTGSASWASDTEYFTTASSGIQLWTVPETATYTIEAAGAGGAPNETIAGGKAAIIKGDVQLTKGEKLQILVGQIARPNPNRIYRHSPGGGGTFIVKNTGLPNEITDIIIVAGGGGGSGSTTIDPEANGQTKPSGGRARRNNLNAGGTGGINGNGGNIGTATANGPGGGFLTDGAASSNAQGLSFLNGGLGGVINTTWNLEGGGFGGGGSPNNGRFTRMSGGGGFSGGGASNTGGDGDLFDETNMSGGGGGSYIQSGITNVATSDGNYDSLTSFSGSAITNLGLYSSGSGYVKITKL